VVALVNLPDEAPVDVSHDIMLRVCDFLTVNGAALLPPAIIPTSDGGVQLTWFRAGIGVEVEFDPDGDILVLIERGDDVTSHVVEGLTDDALKAVLDHVRRD
jgi:hypothetical protein